MRKLKFDALLWTNMSEVKTQMLSLFRMFEVSLFCVANYQ